MAIVNNKNMKFGPISGLLNSVNYYLSAVPSNSLQLVTPNEIVGLYCHDYPRNSLPPFFSGLPLPEIRDKMALARAHLGHNKWLQIRTRKCMEIRKLVQIYRL